MLWFKGREGCDSRTAAARELALAPLRLSQPACRRECKRSASGPLHKLTRPQTQTPTTARPQVGEEGSLDVFSHKHNKWSTFKFDRVFGEASTQDAVYEETKPLIRSVLDGYNVCIFA